MALPTLQEIGQFLRKYWWLFSLLSILLNTPLFWFPFGTIGGILLIIALALLYGWLAGWRLSYLFMTIGPRKFFYVNHDRQKPSVLDDQRFGKHCFCTLKDVRLHYVSNGDRSNQVMLFLHGFPENWFSWRHQLVNFNVDFHTIAMSLRGYGDSDKPKGIASYSVDVLVNDIYQLILHVTEYSSYKKVILVGHDWGGFLSWYVSILHPEVIEKMIIINAPHPKCFIEQLQCDWRQFFKSWYMFFFQLPLLPELMIRNQDFITIEQIFSPFVYNDEELDAYKHYFRSIQDISGPLNYYRAWLRGYEQRTINKKLYSMKKSFHTPIQVPTLILWGCKDSALVTELAEKSIKLCETGIVKYLDDGSHWINIEKYCLVNRMIRDFVYGPIPSTTTQTSIPTTVDIHGPVEPEQEVTNNVQDDNNNKTNNNDVNNPNNNDDNKLEQKNCTVS